MGRPLTCLFVGLLGSVALTSGSLGGPASPMDASTARYIVSFQDAPTREELARLEALAQVVHVYRLIDAALVLATPAVAHAIGAMPTVWRVDADEALTLHLDTSRPAFGVSDEVSRAGRSGEAVTVAIVDTGIDAAHPGVAPNLRAGVVFAGRGTAPITVPLSSDADGHGTHVAGIVAGTGANSAATRPDDRRYAGVAADAGLVALDISASFTTSTAIRAFDWVHENHETYDIRVVQNSWGRSEVGRAFDPADPAVRASSALVRDDGLLVVFSAANEGPNGSTLSIEAMNPDVLTVGAVDDAGRIATFSSRGPVVLEDGTTAAWTKPDVVAPGVRIRSAAAAAKASDGLYSDLSGTSQAAPHVAGLAALVWTANPGLEVFDLMELLRRSARDLGQPGPDPVHGHGLVDAATALELANTTVPGALAGARVERYGASGIVAKGTPGEPGGLPDDTGVTMGAVHGEVPVKPGARTLRVNASASQAAPGTPALALTFSLTDPLGAELTSTPVPIALHNERPTPGVWTWTLTSEQATPGASEYVLEAEVLAPEPLATLDAAGFFDEGPLEAFWNDARANDPFGLRGLGLVGLALLGLVIVVALVGRLVG